MAETVEHGQRRAGFDPRRTAYLEANGWRAYYEHNWPKLLWLMVSLCQEQFHIPFPTSVLAAYYVARAAAAWAPTNNRPDVVQRYYGKFYDLARRYSGLRFDPRQVAELELRYNAEHRRLVGLPDKGPFLDAMVQLHSALLNIPPERALESARWRVEANNTVDEITSGRSRDVAGDWARLEGQLRQCYASMQRELDRAAD